MTTGDTFTCRIESLAYGGDGVARVDGRVVFIPETAPGETVVARAAQVKKSFARAELSELVTASADRIFPCCRVSDPEADAPRRVPGCVYDHLAYSAELQAKTSQLEAFLGRLTRPTEPPLLPPFAAPSPLHYRNKIVLHTARGGEGLRLGYRQEPSHRVLDLPACPLACDAINGALASLRSSSSFAALPDRANVTFRHTPHDGCFWWAEGAAPHGACPDMLTEISPVGPLLVPREGFYQVNPVASDALVSTVAAWFAESTGQPEVLDLYCGVGVFGFACLAAGGTRLTGVESGRAAVSAARLNAKSLGHAATFLCHALGHEPAALSRLLGDPRRTTALVDPPREGLAPDIARALADSGIARILYISCDPATLARDLAILLAGGRYRLLRARLFDLFPRTAHFETLVELARL